MLSDPPSQALDDHIGVALRYAYQRASATLLRRIGHFELSPVQYSILVRLHELGALSQNRLGRSISMKPANIRAAVQRLASRELVSLGSDRADRRMVIVTLTATGRSLVEEVGPHADAANAATLSCLTADEREQLFELLGRIIRSG